MQVEVRGHLVFIEAGNLPELLKVVVEYANKGYTLSDKNAYIAAGSFGHFSVGMDMPEEEIEALSAVEDGDDLLFSDSVSLEVPDDVQGDIDEISTTEQGVEPTGSTDTNTTPSPKTTPNKRTNRRQKSKTV